MSPSTFGGHPDTALRTLADQAIQIDAYCPRTAVSRPATTTAFRMTAVHKFISLTAGSSFLRKAFNQHQPATIVRKRCQLPDARPTARYGAAICSRLWAHAPPLKLTITEQLTSQSPEPSLGNKGIAQLQSPHIYIKRFNTFTRSPYRRYPPTDTHPASDKGNRVKNAIRHDTFS